MRILRSLANRLLASFFLRLRIETEQFRLNAPEQLLLMLEWQRRASENLDDALSLRDVGFQAYSQFDEDGILLYIFGLLGFGGRSSVEICAGDGSECNSANLIINHGFTALLVDGDAENVSKAESFYARHPATKYVPPKIIKEWITAENVNGILEKQGFVGEIDLLSIDIDGVDWWIWRAIETVNPRVVVTEFNHLWGAERAVTVPYDPAFKALFTKYGSDYAGASLPAFVKLAKIKGYRLVGTNKISTNAVFVRNDLVHPHLPEVKPENCFDHPRAQFGRKVRLPGVINMKWEDV